MTRGRRKDTTLPPSRALAIQRAYRDRKAKYVSDLEDRCRKAEEENERLRKELDLARSESTITVANSELVSEKIPRYIFGRKDPQSFIF
jgi:cell shape-determining protein MreC